MGRLTISEFIEALFEAQMEPPAYAMPTCAEAAIAFETLIKRHTNLDEGEFANGSGAFGKVALSFGHDSVNRSRARVAAALQVMG